MIWWHLHCIFNKVSQSTSFSGESMSGASKWHIRSNSSLSSSPVSPVPVEAFVWVPIALFFLLNLLFLGFFFFTSCQEPVSLFILSAPPFEESGSSSVNWRVAADEADAEAASGMGSWSAGSSFMAGKGWKLADVLWLLDFGCHLFRPWLLAICLSWNKISYTHAINEE